MVYMSDMPATAQPTTDPIDDQNNAPLQQDASIAPQAAIQSIIANDPLNPPYAGKSGAKKEISGSSDVSPIEVPGVQVVEHEPNVEISPEVQGWIEKVEQEKLHLPDNIVVADQTAAQPTGTYAAAPVIVLPMTEDQMSSGLKASVKNSVRWLATWCVRVMKKFKGSVVYRKP